MRKIFFLMTVGLNLLLQGCNRDDSQLTPSSKDIDRVASQVDLTKPLVKYYFENYQIGILTNFQDTLDFMYVLGSRVTAEKWARVSLPKLSAAEVDPGLAFLDTTLFRYFRKGIEVNGKVYDSDLFIREMHKTILLCKNLYNENENLDPVLTESDSRVSMKGLGTLHCLGNLHSFAFNVDHQILTSSTSKFLEFKKDNFYVFVSNVMINKNMYDLIPSSFYGSAPKYFGYEMGAKYVEEGHELDSINNLIDKAWFYEKGFVEAKYIYDWPNGLAEAAWITDSDGNKVKIDWPMYNNYTFLSTKGTYVRSFLNQMIYAKAETFLKYPENIKFKFRMLIDIFSGWGVDVLAFNPDLKVLLTE